MAESSFLDQWFEMRNLTLDQVMQQFNPRENAVQHNVSYYNLANVTRVQTPKGHFHFRDNNFALLFLPDHLLEDMSAVTPDALRQSLGKKVTTLPSRAGRRHQQYIYPEKGVAFSAGGNIVDFVEIFPPTDLETYKSTYYKDPGQFRR